MSIHELIETIQYKPNYYAGNGDFIPEPLKSLQVRVHRGEEERFVALAIDCGGETIMWMMNVCAEHAHCIIDGLLAGFERGYAQGIDDIAEEDFANSRKNNANQ